MWPYEQVQAEVATRQPPVRAVELLAHNAERHAQAAVSSAASQIGDLPPLGDADILVLLNAVACAVRKRGDHAGLVVAIDGWATHLDELMEGGAR